MDMPCSEATQEVFLMPTTTYRDKAALEPFQLGQIVQKPLFDLSKVEFEVLEKRLVAGSTVKMSFRVPEGFLWNSFHHISFDFDVHNLTRIPLPPNEEFKGTLELPLPKQGECPTVTLTWKVGNSVIASTPSTFALVDPVLPPVKKKFFTLRRK